MNEKSVSTKYPPNYTFLQALSVVVVLLLAQLHFQTINLGYESVARVICDVTWLWLLATIGITLSNLYWSNTHVAPSLTLPSVLMICGFFLMMVCFVVVPSGPRLQPSDVAPPWLWKLRLALSVIVFASVMLYAITGKRRCSGQDTNA